MGFSDFLYPPAQGEATVSKILSEKARLKSSVNFTVETNQPSNVEIAGITYSMRNPDVRDVAEKGTLWINTRTSEIFVCKDVWERGTKYAVWYGNKGTLVIPDGYGVDDLFGDGSEYLYLPLNDISTRYGKGDVYLSLKSDGVYYIKRKALQYNAGTTNKSYITFRDKVFTSNWTFALRYLAITPGVLFYLGRGNVYFSTSDLDSWNFVAFVFNRDSYTIYHFVTSASNRLKLTVKRIYNRVEIGSITFGGGAKCLVGDLSIFDRALSPDEVRMLYNFFGGSSWTEAPVQQFPLGG